MRYYHVRWIDRLCGLLVTVGLIVLGTSWLFDAPETSMRLMYVAVSCILFGFVLRQGAGGWIWFRYGDSLHSPSCPEGMPQIPSGDWLDQEAELQIGSQVLARSFGLWHRAIVIGFKPGNRVIVHFTGWDSFWDEILHRSKLQIPKDDAADDDVIVPSPPIVETSIREKQ